MTRAQRLVIVIGLLATAWLLHVALCDWAWRDARSTVIFGVRVSAPRTTPQTSPGFPLQFRRGLFADVMTERSTAIILGVAAPLLMTMTALYFAFGWKRAHRRHSGLCLRCGYQLNYDYSSGCPECGWRRAE